MVNLLLKMAVLVNTAWYRLQNKKQNHGVLSFILKFLHGFCTNSGILICLKVVVLSALGKSDSVGIVRP